MSDDLTLELGTNTEEVNDVRKPAPHGDRRSRPHDRGASHDSRRQGHDAARTPTVTVLIPCHNEAATLHTALAAVRGQTYPIQEVVVVADSCTDATATIARDHGCRVIETGYADKASNQNAALPTIDTDIVVGFDGDTIPERMFVARLVYDMLAHGYDATCGQTYPIQRRGMFIRSRRFAYALATQWWRLCQAKVGRIQVLTGACYAFRTDAIKSVGGFPNGLISADMDATWALHKSGYKLGYTPKARTWTWDPPTFRAYRAQMRRWAAGYFQNMAKYRRSLLHWRSMLVVWTAIGDMLMLFWVEALAVWSVVRGDYGLLRSVAIWMVVHTLVTTAMVARVVGVREAALCAVPYSIVNVYNKGVYLCAFFREWVFGRHYATWTGRHGHKLVITPMTQRRKATLFAVGLVTSFLVWPVVLW